MRADKLDLYGIDRLAMAFIDREADDQVTIGRLISWAESNPKWSALERGV